MLMLCEDEPYPGAGYHCLLPAGHFPGPIGEPSMHSDLTIMWNELGEICNLNGTAI